MNTHKKLSLQFLRNNQPDALAVAVPNRSKAPLVKTDFSGPDSVVKSTGTLAKLREEGNADQAGVVLRGKWVDVDLDETNLVLEAALDLYLSTPFVFGRNSKPRSHFLVYLNEDFDRRDSRFSFLATATQLGLNMEIRGHKDNHTMHTNLPGGQHESGEAITWSNPEEVEAALEATPPQMDIFDFARALRMAIVAAKMCEVWNEGSRHEAALGLSGMLRKNFLGMAESSEDPDGAKLALSQADNESIVRFVCEQTGDGEVEDRLKATRGTWKKSNTEQISGYDKLQRLMGDKKARLLRVSISGSAFMDALEQISEQVVYHPPSESYIVLDEIETFGPVMHTMQGYINHLPQHEVSLPGNKKVHAARLLRRFGAIRSVAEFDAIPDHPRVVSSDEYNDAYVLNIFTGWCADEWTGGLDGDSDIEWLNHHVTEIIAGGDERLAKWTLDWFADIAQNPTSKKGTALILVGEQGAGKSSLPGLLAGFLGVPIGSRQRFRNSLFMSTSSTERIIGRFNDILEGKFLIQLEEVIHNASSRSTSSQELASRLKDMITTEEDIIEGKGQKSRRVKNNARYILTSNSLHDAAKIESADRRYAVLEVSPHKKDDLKYWQEAFKRASTAEFHAKVFKWLREREIDPLDIARPPDTQAKRRLVASTAQRDEGTIAHYFLKDLLMRQGNPFDPKLRDAHWEATCFEIYQDYNERYAQDFFHDAWPEVISGDYWARCYEAYRKKRGIYNPLRDNEVHFLTRAFKVEHKRLTMRWTTSDRHEKREERRVRLTTLPPRKKCLNWLEKQITISDEERLLIEDNCLLDKEYLDDVRLNKKRDDRVDF